MKTSRQDTVQPSGRRRLKKLCFTFLLIFIIGGARTPAFAADRVLVATTLWLSEVSAYQWRSAFGTTEAREGLPPNEAHGAEFFFRRPDLTQPSHLLLRRQNVAPSRMGAFGSLTPFFVQLPPASHVALKRLMKIGSERQSREDLFGPQGSLSVSSTSKSWADQMIVEGVNDDALILDSEPKQDGPSASSQLLTEIQDPPSNPTGRRRIVDASEGTPLDPLLNTTYDLNYPKVVPSMKDLTKYAPKRP
jgi:hypothetical protein